MPDGIILGPTQRTRDGRPIVQLFGRLMNGTPFLIEDDRFRPYFFVHETGADWIRDKSLLREAKHAKIEATELRDLGGRPVWRVEVRHPGELRTLRDTLEDRGLRCLEADLRFPYRYLIDLGLRAGVSINGESEPEPTAYGELELFRNPELTPAEVRPELSFLSIDLETTPEANRILSAALVMGTPPSAHEEVHLLYENSVAGAICHPSERELLIAVVDRIRALDPDVILGWNVVDFDLRVFDQRCKDLKVSSATRALGRLPGETIFLRDSGFTRQRRANIPGRVVLDGIGLARDALRLDDYRLETAAQFVLGRGKEIDHDVADKAGEIQRLYRDEPEALVAYNLEDARLVPELLEKEGLLDLVLERSLLCGMPLDRVGASIASFDRLYLPALRHAGRVAWNVELDRKVGASVGGAVFEPEAGLRRNVAVFDFKSLYPSLMRTFQLDPLAQALAKDAPDQAIEAPNGAHFARSGAILPGLLSEFAASRERAKLRGDRHADQAIKIMMNSMYGIFAASACRFFSAEMANAITRFGHQLLNWTRSAFEEHGVSVIYGDTDSVFVQLGAENDPEASLTEANGLLAHVQKQLRERIESEYRVESHLELELEKIYERFFQPRVRGGRGGRGGSKKRYAGWRSGELELVGLESVRRDWPPIAARLQQGLLERLFTDRDPLPFAEDLARKLQQGEVDDQLIYIKRVRKQSLDSYTKSRPPHVQAARKQLDQGIELQGSIVRYVITHDGPEPILPGQPHPKNIDRRHYLNKVLRPIADSILTEVNLHFADAIGEPRQLPLI